MKPILWLVIAAIAVVGLAALAVPTLQAQQRKCVQYRVGQSAAEASALLAQEWARAHAHPGH